MTVNSRRKAYSLLRGAFSRDGIAAYIRELIGQRGITIPLRGDLPKVETIEPWDGKDGEVPCTVKTIAFIKLKASVRWPGIKAEIVTINRNCLVLGHPLICDLLSKSPAHPAF